MSGQVLLDGSPLAEAGVMFMPAGQGPIASGSTNSDGHFKLMTVNDEGVMPGAYKVVIAKRKYVPAKPGQPAPPSGLVVEWYSPIKYSNPATSGLTEEVKREANEFRFELSSTDQN